MNKHPLIKIICSTLAFLTVLNLTNGKSSTYNRIKLNSNEETETEDSLYVEDIVGYAPNSDGYNESIVNNYIKNGYIKSSHNFNQLTTFEVTADVYLLYKTTTDKSKALRKISTMSMDGGYTDWDYSSFVESKESGISESIKELKASSQTFIEKFNGQSKAAVAAKKLLDVYYVPEKVEDATGTPLGTWLLNKNHTNDEYKKVLLYSNTTISTNMMSALLLASLDNSDTTWLDRFVLELQNSTSDSENPDNEEDFNLFREEYGSTLEIIQKNIVSFYENASSAKKKVSNNEIDLTDKCDSLEDAVEQTIENINSDNQKSQDTVYAQCDNILASYPVYNIAGQQVETNLSEIISEIGESDLDSTIGYIYALVNALNPGQYYGLKTVGLGNLILYSSFDIATGTGLTGEDKTFYKENGLIESIENKLIDSKKIIKETTGSDTLSIYVGTNSDLLEKNCALTDDAVRSNSALRELDKLTCPDTLQENLLKALVNIGFIAGVCAGVAIASLSIGMFVFSGLGFIDLVTLGIGVMSGWVSATATTVIGAAVGVIAAGLLGVCIVASVIIGCIFLIKYLIENYKSHNIEYSDIPDVMIDRKYIDCESIYSRYDAVKNICTGKPLDLNFQKITKDNTISTVYLATKWQALYVTKDTRLGAPIVVKNGDFVNTTKEATPSFSLEGMYPICNFGNYVKANLNSYIRAQVAHNSLYAYYYIEGESIDYVDADSNTGKYLESVYLASDKSGEAAKLSLYNKGYSVIDHDLSPDNDFRTYIGFKTTNLEEQALTDIRVAWNDRSQSISWGDSTQTYGYAGSAQENISTLEDNGNSCHISLFMTKNKKLGTPILSHVNVSDTSVPDGLVIYNDIGNAREGLEGINYFSGGRAADFNAREMIKRKYWYYCTKFIFFRPSEEYTSEKYTDIYVSGIGIFTGNEKANNVYLHEYYTHSGFMPNECGGTKFETIHCGQSLPGSNGLMYFEASYTYNPYRAITDMGIFTGQPNISTLQFNMVAHDQGYCAANVYTQGNSDYFEGNGWIANYRIIRDSHTFYNNHDTHEGMTMNTSWQITPTAFYVAGPTTGRDLLRPGSIRIFNSKNIIGSTVGLNSVHELKTTYYDDTDSKGNSVGKLYNLGLDADGTAYERSLSKYFYMFYSAKPRVKPKYVCKVMSAEYNSYNEAIMNLMFSGIDEIFEKNTISCLNKDSSTYDEQVFFHNEDNYNMWVDLQSSHWKFHNFQTGVTFIGVKYTNKLDEALGTVKVYSETGAKYRERGETNPSDKMYFTVDTKGTKRELTRCGERITAEYDNYMWLYASKDGEPITKMQLEIDSFDVKLSDETIESHQYNFSKHIVTDQNMSKSGTHHMDLYYESSSAKYIKDISYSVVKKTGISDLVKSMILKGYEEFKIYQVDTSSSYLVIGISRTSSYAEGIKDIRFTTKTLNNSDSTMTIGNFLYYSGYKFTCDQQDTASTLSIYYTRGLSSKDHKDYALIDFVFADINGDQSGELAYDLGVSPEVLDATVDRNFTFASNGTTYGVYLKHKKESAEWKFQGPNSTTASIFVYNPSLAVLLIFIAITLLAAFIVPIIRKRKYLTLFR